MSIRIEEAKLVRMLRGNIILGLVAGLIVGFICGRLWIG